MNPAEQRKVTKYVHLWWPTGKQQHRIRPSSCDQCPRCKKPQEDPLHVLQCAGPGTEPLTFEIRGKIRLQIKGRPHSNLLESIVNAMTDFTRRKISCPEVRIVSIPLHHKKAITKALDAQAEIGWFGFFRGYIATEWANAYNECHPEDKPISTMIGMRKN